ncbi:MAG TPA: TonB family protein [Longimicrobiales bacterium]
MVHAKVGSAGPAGRLVTANDRLKARSRKVLWLGVLAAALLHVGLLWLAPVVGRIGPWLTRVDRLALHPPLEVTPSRAPRTAAAVGVPVPAAVGDAYAEEIPPPPKPLYQPPPDLLISPELAALMDGPTFTPYQVAPRLTNREAMVDSLHRLFVARYPDVPEQVRVQVWSLVDEQGAVRKTLIKQSSGHADLDAAVLEAAGLMEFTPAWSGGRTVPVWISLPIVFQISRAPVAAPDTAGGADLAPRQDSTSAPGSPAAEVFAMLSDGVPQLR